MIILAYESYELMTQYIGVQFFLDLKSSEKSALFLELRNDPEMAQIGNTCRCWTGINFPRHSWQRSYNNRRKAMESHLLRNRDPSNISQPPLRIINFLIPILQSLFRLLMEKKSILFSHQIKINQKNISNLLIYFDSNFRFSAAKKSRF